MISEAAGAFASAKSERCMRTTGNVDFSGSKSNTGYFRIILVLSISLFLLLFLKVALWNSPDTLLQSFIGTSMWILLWTDSILITYVIPAIIGSNFLQGLLGSKRSNSQQKPILINFLNRNRWLRAIGSVLGIYGSATFFHSLETMVAVTYQSTIMESPSLSSSFLARLISRICAFGLAISSAMNGFGSVSLPYTFLVGFLHEPISTKHMANVQDELEKIQSIFQIIRNHQKPCSKTSTNPVGAIKCNSIWGDLSATITSNGTGTLIRRSVPSAKLIADASIRNNSSNINPNNNKHHEKSNIFHAHFDTTILSRREIATMEELHDDLARELEEMRCIAKASSLSTGCLCSGYFFRTIGFTFSMVLILRLYLATTSIISFSWKRYRTVTKYSLHYGSSPERLDLITRTLTWLAGYNLVSVAQFHNISQGCCLLLTFGLAYTQVGNFLSLASELNKRFSCCCPCIVSKPKYQEVEESTKQITRPHRRVFYPNITSIIMGSYFLSCVIVIGTTLPEEHRAPLVNALHGATFSFHPYYLDLIYTLSATVTLILFASITRIRRQNALNRYLNDEIMDIVTKEQRHLESVC